MRTQHRGQILVILVIVLLLLAIIIMSIVAVVTKDIEQVANSQQYSTSYNKSEEKLLNIVSKYSNINLSLDNLLEDGCHGSEFEYECVFNEDQSTTTLRIEDTSDVSDFELSKDETLKLKLDESYKGELDIRWTGEAALNLTFEYKNSNGEYKVVKDIYDNHQVLSQSGLSASDHLMNYTVINSDDNHILIDISSISEFDSLSDTPLFFKIKVLSKTNSSVLVSVRGDISFPKQIRRFEAVTQFDTNTSASMPILISQIPLAGREPELLDYVLLTPDTIIK